MLITSILEPKDKEKRGKKKKNPNLSTIKKDILNAKRRNEHAPRAQETNENAGQLLTTDKGKS